MKIEVGGFFGLLGLLFIGLKLGHVINWSWWLVLLPIYGPTGLVVGGLGLFTLGCFALAGVAGLVAITIDAASKAKSRIRK